MYKQKKNKIYNILLIVFFLAIYVFCLEVPLIANEGCKPFPFTEQWGKTPEEFKESIKEQKLEGFTTSDLSIYSMVINLYNENAEVAYVFENNKLSSIVNYFNLQNLEKAQTFYYELENSLNCLFSKPNKSIDLKNSKNETKIIIWEKNKTGVIFMFVKHSSSFNIEFFDITNEINEAKIKEMIKIKNYK